MLTAVQQYQANKQRRRFKKKKQKGKGKKGRLRTRCCTADPATLMHSLCCRSLALFCRRDTRGTHSSSSLLSGTLLYPSSLLLLSSAI